MKDEEQKKHLITDLKFKSQRQKRKIKREFLQKMSGEDEETYESIISKAQREQNEINEQIINLGGQVPKENLRKKQFDFNNMRGDVEVSYHK